MPEADTADGGGGDRTFRIAASIPCYKVTNSILELIEGIGPEVETIYCVDDKCPDASGRFIEEHVTDPRVIVVYNEKNRGVGGATMAGFRRALEDGADIVIKLDGDGQMDPTLVPRFAAPIISGRADYAKGNRFFHPSSVRGMPFHRLIGNAGLSFLTKLSSGYWHLFDPVNGYVAIHRTALANLPFDDISERYFFESDMLFHLNIIGAVVEEVPMDAVYGDEQSHMVVRRLIFEFLIKNVRNTIRRLVYNYYLRNFTIGSLEILLAIILLAFGPLFGLMKWIETYKTGSPVTAGTVMLAALPIILGLQLLLSFLGSDMQRGQTVPLHKRLDGSSLRPARAKPDPRDVRE